MGFLFRFPKIDTIAALMLIVLLLPPMVLIALLVKMESRGPVFYLQERVGRNSSLFDIYKFRTMYHDPSNDPSELTTPHDKRLTRLGRLLRMYKLDELPQLLNIVKGDMVFFGSRPEQPCYVESIVGYSASFESIYRHSPGLISLGVIKTGYATRLEQMIRRAKYDKYFLWHDGLRLRCWLVYKSFRSLFNGRKR